MRTALRHIGDGIEWAGLDEESPGTGKRRAGAHSLRHSAARHWLMVGKVPLNVVSQWLGHANVQVTLRIYLPIVGSDYGMEIRSVTDLVEVVLQEPAWWRLVRSSMLLRQDFRLGGAECGQGPRGAGIGCVAGLFVGTSRPVDLLPSLVSTFCL